MTISGVAMANQAQAGAVAEARRVNALDRRTPLFFSKFQ